MMHCCEIKLVNEVLSSVGNNGCTCKSYQRSAVILISFFYHSASFGQELNYSSSLYIRAPCPTSCWATLMFAKSREDRPVIDACFICEEYGNHVAMVLSCSSHEGCRTFDCYDVNSCTMRDQKTRHVGVVTIRSYTRAISPLSPGSSREAPLSTSISINHWNALRKHAACRAVDPPKP